jgi:hypothetical protein
MVKQLSGPSPQPGDPIMARANPNPTTKLSTLFTDPFLKDAFRRAEDDGPDEAFAECDHPRSLDGGAAEQLCQSATGRRVLVEA